MPGDPLTMMMRNPRASQQAIEKAKEFYGLNQPMPIQFAKYIKDLFKADFGVSFMFKKPVIDVIGDKVGPTLLLLGVSELIAIFLGIFLGVVAASKRGGIIDIGTISTSLLMYSLPTFLLGMVLISLFSVYWGLFPSTGMVTAGARYSSIFHRIGDLCSHMFLPAITLALTLIGEYAMLMRSSLLEVFSEDFIVTARAKGLKERDVIRKHGYPNALLPVVTAISINLGLTIAGAVQVETVFSWPGIGRLMYDALNNRDYPLLQGIFLLVCICVVFANLLSDILYMALDPRVKS
jgi:peptide/nickel transport system permease protein